MMARALLGALLLTTGCLTGAPETESGRLSVALTAPAADISEIRSIGLFAVATPPVVECEEYLSGERDPISETPENLVALEFVEVEVGDTGFSTSFVGIPVGDQIIIVEAYDSGESRIFMGCGQTRIVEGQSTPLTIEMHEDPVATD